MLDLNVTLASLLVSQLLGAAGDTLGSRLGRVVYHGSAVRMMLATSVVGVLLTTTCLLGLNQIGAAEVRFGYILSAPDLWAANGILAAAYNTGEAYLLLYSFGAVIKSITPLVAPAVLYLAERQGWFAQPAGGPGSSGGGQGDGSQLLMITVGTAGALVLASLGWERRGMSSDPKSRPLSPPSEMGRRPGGLRDADAAEQTPTHTLREPVTSADQTPTPPGTDTLLASTATLVLCNTGWNGLQRVSATHHHVNAFEWVLLDKVVGGAFALAFLAIKAKRSGEPLEWGPALQNSVASAGAAVALLAYVLLQLLRLALVFLIVGTGTSGVATGTFLVTVVRVALAATANLLITWLAPKFLDLSGEDVAHLMAPPRLRKAMFGGVLITASVGLWYETALGTPRGASAALADNGPPVVMAVGDWGLAEGDWVGVVPRAMMEYAYGRDAVILNLGDSFYPDGVLTEAEYRRREAVYAAQFQRGHTKSKHSNTNVTKPAAQRYHSVLGNHDYRGNVTATLAGAATGWLGFEQTSWHSWHDPRLDATFVAIDTNFVQAPKICSGTTAPEQACRAAMDQMQTAQLAWLERVLADAQKRGVTWCIVFGHHPIIGAGKWAFYEADKRLALRVLAPLFERYDVALYLSGHDHVQQLYARAGVGYAISGAGGAELDDEPLANAAETKAQHATLLATGSGHGFAALHFDTGLDVLCIDFVTAAGPCTDVASFIDARGHGCIEWEGHSCDVSSEGHNESDMAAVRKNCPRSCGSCKEEAATVARPGHNISRQECLLGVLSCPCFPSKRRRGDGDVAFTEQQKSRRRHLSKLSPPPLWASAGGGKRPAGLPADSLSKPAAMNRPGPSSLTAEDRAVLADLGNASRPTNLESRAPPVASSLPSSAPDPDFKRKLRRLYEAEGLGVRVHECSWRMKLRKDQKWPDGPNTLPDPDLFGALGDWEQDCIDDELALANMQGGAKIAGSFLAPGLPTAVFRPSGHYPDGTHTQAGWLMDPRRLTVLHAFPHDCYCGSQGLDDEPKWSQTTPMRGKCGTQYPAQHRQTWGKRIDPERNASEYAERRVDMYVAACANPEPNRSMLKEAYFNGGSCWLPSFAEAATYQRAWMTEFRRRGLAKSKCLAQQLHNEIRVVFDLSAVIGVFFVARSRQGSDGPDPNHRYARKVARALAAAWGRKEPAPIVAILPDHGVGDLKPFNDAFVFPAPATFPPEFETEASA